MPHSINISANRFCDRYTIIPAENQSITAGSENHIKLFQFIFLS
ncbi:hypothetical protein KL86DYS2_10656 [uncultured Dysgonomonas sp.]|uniref:Uncharacterized protein n=1 Tax=uncultured Dysgonomonas sp. TaxID=206096 RepID=A0A212J3K7_9BACT|nr:hypothetical protein KL86DYS2_10656 [uncultured Dysgonomonas sp.]